MTGPRECSDSPESAACSGWGREGKGESPGEATGKAGGERESGTAVAEVCGTDVEEEEGFSVLIHRSQEEVASLKRKLEKYKSRDWAYSSDEVLLEEIRTYKVELPTSCM